MTRNVRALNKVSYPHLNGTLRATKPYCYELIALPQYLHSHSNHQATWHGYVASNIFGPDLCIRFGAHACWLHFRLEATAAANLHSVSVSLRFLLSRTTALD